VSKLCEKYDVDLEAETPAEVKTATKVRRSSRSELNESNKHPNRDRGHWRRKAFSIDHYSAQRKPLFELIEGSPALRVEPKRSRKKTDAKIPKAARDSFRPSL